MKPSTLDWQFKLNIWILLPRMLNASGLQSHTVFNQNKPRAFLSFFSQSLFVASSRSIISPILTRSIKWPQIGSPQTIESTFNVRDFDQESFNSSTRPRIKFSSTTSWDLKCTIFTKTALNNNIYVFSVQNKIANFERVLFNFVIKWNGLNNRLASRPRVTV